MNWANRLTLSRLALTVLFVAALSSPWRYAHTTALVTFLVAGVTDFFDGEIARRYQTVTNFGKLMDPLVDKIMIVSAFICLVATNDIPAWTVIIIVSREFLITGLRLIGVSRGRTLPAERLGKHKTVWQMVTVVYYLLLKSINEASWVHLSPTAETIASGVGTIVLSVAVILTLFSGLSYLAKNRDLVSDV